MGLIHGLLCLVGQMALPRRPSQFRVSLQTFLGCYVSFSFFPPSPRTLWPLVHNSRFGPTGFPPHLLPFFPWGSSNNWGAKGSPPNWKPYQHRILAIQFISRQCRHTEGPQYFLNEWQYCFLANIQLDIFIYWEDDSCALFFFLVPSLVSGQMRINRAHPATPWPGWAVIRR